MMRQAIAPRLAMRTLRNIHQSPLAQIRHLDRRGVVGVAGIVELRAVGNQHDDVHLARVISTYLPGAERPSSNVRSAVRRHRHVHEEIDVVADVALRQAVVLVLGDCEQEAVAARVHRFLFERITHRIAFRRAGAAERVVTADRYRP